MSIEPETLQKIYDAVIEYLVRSGFQLVISVIILLVGWKLASWLSRLFLKLCQKRHLDITLAKFLAGVLKAVVLAFALLVALDKLGITISPFIATISALIFGASFAIQAPLSNYAAGLSIIFSRPFVVGNTITIKGFNGVVEEVKLPSTILSTADGEKITIPNKDIVGEVIVNAMANKVSETVVGISYEDDPEKAAQLIRDALRRFPQILTDPAPQVGIQGFGDSSINIGVRYWAPTQQYLQTLHEANLAIYRALQNARITIPFPRRDLHIVKESSS